jgi:hypothetical protein
VAGLAIKAQAATHAALLAANHRPCGIIFMLLVPSQITIDSPSHRAGVMPGKA